MNILFTNRKENIQQLLHAICIQSPEEEKTRVCGKVWVSAETYYRHYFNKLCFYFVLIMKR